MSVVAAMMAMTVVTPAVLATVVVGVKATVMAVHGSVSHIADIHLDISKFKTYRFLFR